METTKEQFLVGEAVGPGRVWGDVGPGDTFALPCGETLIVKSRTKRHVSFIGDGPMYEKINIVHDIHPGAVYEGRS